MLQLFLFSNKMLVIRADIKKMLVRIANTEDIDQNDLSVYICDIFCTFSLILTLYVPIEFSIHSDTISTF